MDTVDQSQAGPYRSIAGALIIAVLLDWGLFGVLVTQTYGYYLAFPRDRFLAKSIVYTVLLIETAQTVVVSHDIFLSFATSLGDPSAVDAIRNGWFSIPVCGGITGGIGQVFFSYRIWMMSDKKSLGAPLITATLAMASVVSALVSARAFFHVKSYSTLMGNSDISGLLASIGVWNGIGAISDITIALCMPYYLMRHGTGMRTTHVMIVKLVKLIIETGGLTAIIAILHLCLYFSNFHSFVVPGLILSKIYGNTMLVILNNRMKFVEGRFANDSEDLEDTPDSPRRLFSNSTNSARSRSGSTIIVSNDRLIFRLDDIHRTTSRLPRVGEEEPVDHDGAQKYSEDGETLSLETRTVPNLARVPNQEPSLHFGLPHGKV